MIDFYIHQQKYSIPNAWNELTPALFEGIMVDARKVSLGVIPPAMVGVNHVCRSMEWRLEKIVESKDEVMLANLSWLSEQVNFVFTISYPDNDAVLQDLSKEDYQKAKRTPPERLKLPIARFLKKLDYKFTLNSCFSAQLVPFVHLKNKIYFGYKIDTGYDRLTCSLTALQFIEARNLNNDDNVKLPLLAAILYHPGAYNSQSAHVLARDFECLPADILQNIAFNFTSFVNFLFSRTDFKLLIEGEDEEKSAISTGPLESLYNLSSDGYGDVSSVEQMNIIQYLTILRKKLIETVRSMNYAEMETVDIAKKTGLPISLIKQII